MIKEADIDQFQGRFQPLRDALVSLAGLCHTGGMVVSEYDGGRVDAEGFLDDLPGVDGGISLP